MSPRMKIAFAVIGLLWLLAFFGGHFLHDKPHANDMDLGTEVSIFRDVPLKITRKEVQADGSLSLTAETTDHGEPVGLQVVIGPQWDKIVYGDLNEYTGYHGKVTYVSLGKESNRLVEMLNEYYSCNLPPKPMAAKVNFEAFALKENPQMMDKFLTSIDLAHQPPKHIAYAQWMVDVDLPHSQLTLREKEASFRKTVLKILRGE